MQESGDDAILRISEIKIQDPSRWTQNARMEDYIEDNKIFSRSMFRRSGTLNERRSTTVNDSTNQASAELGMITL